MEVKKATHRNIPVFIPHLGCPHSCVFCNQNKISGTKSFDRDSVRTLIDNVLKTTSDEDEREIAFFGGSFTGIDRDLMIFLLDTAQEYVSAGKADSIRLSTRPDYISGEIMDILSSYSVKTVELGIQSLDPKVLDICERGHTPEQSEIACRMIKERGMRLVGQMMTLLPGATPESEVMTAEKICSFGADGARIYPAVVLKGTKLERMAKEGLYVPADTEESVRRGCDVLEVVVKNGVSVIRIGLCSSDITPDDAWGGTFSPAIGEMIESELFRRNIARSLDGVSETEGRTLKVFCPEKCLSKAVGQRRKNVLSLKSEYGFKDVKIVESGALFGYNIKCVII